MLIQNKWGNPTVCNDDVTIAKRIRNVVAGASAIDLKRGLGLGFSLVVASLQAQSRPVGTPREKAQVASLSAHNDAVIGQLVADALRGYLI
nr:hypothetical protein [Pseudomonas chlororaphis]